MKFINYIFFNIYRYNYEKKLEGRKIDPATWSSFMLGICVGGWSILLIYLFDLVSKKNTSSNIYELICCCSVFISAGLINNYYTNNYRYQDIYNYYTTNNRIKNKRKAWLLSYLFLISPYLISAVILLIFGRSGNSFN
jgi:hypothetical protein